jgi:hypothetical protein
VKIAILYVCTGKYIRFWKEFYRSAEQHFMTGAQQRQYFVFTDQDFPEQDLPQVTKIEQANLGWPDNTLKRYHMFQQVEEQLARFDYLYFFNANCVFKQDVGVEFLPESSDQLVVVRHPGQVNNPVDRVPYERNPRSRAAIPVGEGKYYVCGGVNGGSTAAFLGLIRSVRQAVDADYRDGIVAEWHDESHLNRYILDHPHCVKHAGYCYPQGWTLKEPQMIEVRNKNILGGTEKLRALGNKNQPESMVTVAIYGGLGNQLFQYSVGRSLAQRNGCRLQLDTRHFDENSAFRYGLGNFNIEAVVGTSRTLPPTKQDGLQYWKWRYFSKRHRMIREQGLSFDSCVLEQTGSIYLRGYWQSDKYFAQIASQIRSELTLTDPPMGQNAELLDQIRSSPSIAVHVRRGDYVSNPQANKFHGTLPPEYFRRGLQQIAQRIQGYPTIYIFSDDYQWAQKNIHTDYQTVFVHHNDGYSAHEDLRLMSACQHQVISNSTFSWWAAWLNPNPDKQVIAPAQWFADPRARNDDLIPPNWDRLDFTQPAAKDLLAA